MEITQLIRTLFGSMDSEYIQQNDDRIIDLLERAANALDKLETENKQLRNDLIMKTALAQNMQNIIDDDKQLTKIFEALLKDFKEFMLNPDDACKYCKYNQSCYGNKCELYIEGREAWGHNGCKHDWAWSCMDFNFGECPMLENTPCNGCIKHNMQGFSWRGM